MIPKARWWLLSLVPWLFLGAACEGSGSDIGPEIEEFEPGQYRVLVQNDQRQAITGARVSVQGVPIPGSTGRFGRASLATNPTGVRLLTVDGRNGAAFSSDRLGTLTVAASMPDGGELPYAFYLPNTAASATTTVAIGNSPGAVLDDSANSGAIVTIPAGTSVGAPIATTVDLSIGVVSGEHLPGALPGPVLGARLWGDGVYLAPPEVTFSPGAALSVTNDLGLAAGATAELFRLNASNGLWESAGTGTVDGGGTRIDAPVGSVPTGGLYAFAIDVQATTLLTGLVITRLAVPLPGVLVRALGATTRTLSDGTFFLPPIPAVDGSGAPLAIEVEVHGGRLLRPTSTAKPAALTPGVQDVGPIRLTTYQVASIRLQLINRGAISPNRPFRVSTALGASVGIGVSDENARVNYEDIVTNTFVGVLTSRPKNLVEIYLAQAAASLNLGVEAADLQVFYREANWWDGRSSEGSTATYVVSALGTGPVQGAAVVSGAIPGIGFIEYTQEVGVVAADYGNVGQATATAATLSSDTTVIAATTLVDIDSARIEIPLETAVENPVGGFERFGMVQGQLLGANVTDPKTRRVRATRYITLEDWYDEVFLDENVMGRTPTLVDPAVTGGTDFVVGVATPRGHIAGVEGTTSSGVFQLERLGFEASLRPLGGERLTRDIDLDLIADTEFDAPFSLTNLRSPVASLRFDLAEELRDRTLIDVVRGAGGNLTVGGGGVTFMLPALEGPLAGGRHLVALHASDTNGGKTVEQSTFIPFRSTSGPVVRFLDVPDILQPAPGATVRATGFRVFFTIPISTLYTVVELRAVGPGETRNWTAVLPASIDYFDFRTLPPGVVNPLEAGITWTLTVTAARVETGPLSLVNDAYRRMLQNYVGIGPQDREVNAYSSTSIQVTTN